MKAKWEESILLLPIATFITKLSISVSKAFDLKVPLSGDFPPSRPLKKHYMPNMWPLEV